jgi:WD40 repeat protein
MELLLYCSSLYGRFNVLLIFKIILYVCFMRKSLIAIFLLNSMVLLAQNKIKEPIITLPGHSADVNAVGYSLPAFGVIVSGGWDNTINVYKADSTFDKLATLTGHISAVKAVAFNLRLKIFATCGNDFNIILWDSLFRRIRKLEDINKGHNSKINTITFDKSGKYLLSGDDEGKILLWDIATGKIIKSHSNGKTINQIVMAANPQEIIVAGVEPTIKVINFVTGAVVKTIVGHKDLVNSVAVSFNNKYLLSGSNDKSAKMWDLRTLKEIRTLPVDCWKVTAVAFTLDSRYCATACNNGSIKIWETETGKLLTEIEEQGFNARDISFSPNAKYLAVAPLIRNNSDFGVRIYSTMLVKEAETKKLVKDSLNVKKTAPLPVNSDKQMPIKK